jgi:hypothetical protein
MREQVRQLLELGRLPDWNADAERIDLYADLIQAIERPVTDEEAKVLVTLFGPDDCYGAAWTLLHLIETAPSWPMKEWLYSLTDPPDSDWKWIARLQQRARNAEKDCDEA